MSSTWSKAKDRVIEILDKADAGQQVWAITRWSADHLYGTEKVQVGGIEGLSGIHKENSEEPKVVIDRGFCYPFDRVFFNLAEAEQKCKELNDALHESSKEPPIPLYT